MFWNIQRNAIACALVATLATSALAAGPRSLSEYLDDGRTFFNNPQGRQVRVVRGQAEMTPGEEIYDDQAGAAPQPVPEPIDGNLGPQWDEPWGPQNQMDGNCGAGDCGAPCQDCGCVACCCTPWWAHRTYVFGEYLYLLPSDADMAQAFQQNGTGGLGTVPYGQVGVIQPSFVSAYRTGFGIALGCYASLNASYSRLDSHATDELGAPSITGGNVQSLVLHPNSLNAGSTSSLVNAFLDIDYQLAEIEYRRLLTGNFKHAINYSVGARYGKLNQNFLQIGDFTPPTGTIQTTSDITFEGVGLRAGLDGEHRLGCTRFAGYGKLFMNVLYGEFDSTYEQLNLTTTDIQALSHWKDRRVLPILEYEVGLNWTSRRGHWRLSTGYYAAFWYNTITTGQFVQAVQNADFVDVGETISFTGLVSRIEFRR